MSRFFIIFLTLFFIAGAAEAQLAGGGFEVSISPETPAPFEEITISLDSFVFDINQANIRFIVDGSEALRGTGERILKLKAKDVGERTVVDIIVTSSSGQVAKRAVIIPAGIDILIEAIDVYTPPFYRGRSLPTTESRIKAVAMPNIMVAGRKIAPNQLGYEWSRSGNIDQSGFGFKKSFFVFKNSMLNKRENIGVSASGQQAELGGSTVNLEMTAPKILFYEDSEEGVKYERALDSLSLHKEATVVAEPFFFSPRNIADSLLQFTWKINNNEVATPVKNKINIQPMGSDGLAGEG